MTHTDVLKRAIGHEIVVDYQSGDARAYAKGVLVSVEGTKICVTNPRRIWLIETSHIVALRLKVTAEDREEGGLRDRMPKTEEDGVGDGGI